uniref:RING-type domain-containing protein n=1 Tax=Scylla olivacea TaxID=85551 RepID=A0A0P4VWK1_SCYOL
MALSEFCSHFPLLCPRCRPSKPPHEFCGFVDIGGVDREVRVETPHFPRVEGMRISSDTCLQELVVSHMDQLLEAQKTSSTALEYLQKFQKVCSEAVRCDNRGREEGELQVELNESLVRCLLAHLEGLGWSRVQQVSPNFTSFTLQTRDAGERVHLLRVRVADGYPHEEPTVEADLPGGFEFIYEPSEGVAGVVRVWEARLASLQEFWDVMDQIDKAALVLDPPTPCRHHTFRRLLLGNQVNVQVTLSPQQPRHLPQCLLFGPSKRTRPINTRLTHTYEEWDAERSFVENLEHLLGESVVRECGGVEGVEQEVECPICYSLHFQGSLPDQPCEHCCTPFHAACLYDWLSSLPAARQSINIITGECPYCSKNITCKIPV